MAGKPDKRGHIDTQITFFNTSSNTYKYVDFFVEAYNRVGDPLLQSGDDLPTVKLRFTGPLPPRRSPGVSIWPQTWRDPALHCIAIKRIEIFHMNGTHRPIEAAELRDVVAENLPITCIGSSKT